MLLEATVAVFCVFSHLIKDEGADEENSSGEPGKDVPAPLPLVELAPPPKQEDLFGK